jgi:hypothetical protein
VSDKVTRPSTDDWLKSLEDHPIYSGELTRKRHWLEPVSTMFTPSNEDLTEEELYLKYRDRRGRYG